MDPADAIDPSALPHTPPGPATAINADVADEAIPATGGQWHALTHQPTFAAAHAMLLDDGTVLVQELSTASWFKLTPDKKGSYQNGTWKSLRSTPNGYAPLYYASALLPDGRVVIQGGEYDGNAQTESNLGAVYDPGKNTWTALAAPAGWTEIGDAQSVVLPNGKIMIGNCCTTQQAILDPTTLKYAVTGTGKLDVNSEETWTLLWDGTVLTVDVSNTAPDESEIYSSTTGRWTKGATTHVTLVDAGLEIGPAVVRYDGTVFAAGATGHTAIYNQTTKTWKAGPNFPGTGSAQLDTADAPAALLPNGNVLVAASPGDYNAPSKFFEFDGSKLDAVAAPVNAPNDSSYQFNFVVLPTGQILATDFSTEVELYTPAPPAAGFTTPFEPVIEAIAGAGSGTPTLTHGKTFVISAKRMNGLSQGAIYGDDAQSATNFPVVRLTNHATGDVVYARTHNASTFAIGPTVTGTVSFDVPATVELGSAAVQIVTNGIASPAVAVKID
jgi:hypothetical protein